MRPPRAGWLLVAGLLAGLPARALAAEVSIDSRFDQETVGLDQTAVLTIEVTVHGNASLEKVDLPQALTLAVIGTSKSEQSRITMGGGGFDSSHTTLYRMNLKPLKMGDVVLTPALVTVGGKVFKGSVPHLKVVGKGQGPSAPARSRQPVDPFAQLFGSGFAGGFPGGLPPGFGQQDDQDAQEDPFAQLFGNGRPPSGEDVVLVGSVDKKKAFLGEQLTYSVRLFTRADVNEFSELKLPGFDGFWGEDIETPSRPSPKVQTLGGVPYQVYLLKKKALFPDRAGTLSIAPAELDVSVGLGFFRGRKVHRESAPLKIQVEALPPGAPAGFPVTNVGQWRLNARLSPASVPVGEPATFTLTVDGEGNLHGLTLPTLPAIPGLRAYDPTSTDKVSPQGEHFGGRRQVDVILIPQRTGDFELPALVFQWYDPKTGYQSITTPKLALRATVGGKGSDATANAEGQNVLESPFRPLRDRPGMDVACASPGFHLPEVPELKWAAAGFGVPPIGFAVLALVGAWRTRRLKQAPALRGRRAYRNARRRLEEAVESGAAADFAQAIFGYLEDRLGEQVAGLSFGDLKARLLALGVEEATVRSTLQTLELAESLRYMPRVTGQVGGPPGSDRDLDRLKSMAEFALEALERATFKGPKSGARAA